MSQFRQNPISKHWVLIAPNRAKRPEDFGALPATDANLPEVDPHCAFCPGNEGLNREIARFPDNKNWQVRIIPNKFESLSHIPLSQKREFYVNRAGSGDHEVVLTRKHNEPIALQSMQTVELSMRVFRQRILDLKREQHLAYVQLFHNHGRDGGASLVHPHYQLMATPMVPPGLHDELSGCWHYFQTEHSCIYCDIMKEERVQQQRVIFETEHFMAFTPYASRNPFETWVLPKRHTARFEDSSDEELEQLAYVMKVILGQMYVKLNNPALNFYLHSMPFPQSKHLLHEEKAYHWHMTIFTRLTIWAGFEYGTGIPVNPVTPEDAAAFLR